MYTRKLDLPQTFVHWVNISSLVGNIVRNNCCLYLKAICIGAAIFNNRISGKFFHGLQQSCVLINKENKILPIYFLVHKKANEISNLVPLWINYLKVF
jgi:hypothetical protein